MYTDDQILNAVQRLQPQWATLLDDTSVQETDSLLASAQDDETKRRAANQLLDIFDRNNAMDPLRQALNESINENATELSYRAITGVRYFSPDGRSGPVAVPGVIYRCPNHGCSERWSLRYAGETVPRCEEHNVFLVPE